MLLSPAGRRLEVTVETAFNGKNACSAGPHAGENNAQDSEGGRAMGGCASVGKLGPARLKKPILNPHPPRALCGWAFYHILRIWI